MYYLARKLFLPKGDSLGLQVVEVRGGVVIGYSDFVKECSSMLLVDALFLSRNPFVKRYDDIKKETEPALSGQPLLLYVPEDSSMPVAEDTPLVRLL